MKREGSRSGATRELPPGHRRGTKAPQSRKGLKQGETIEDGNGTISHEKRPAGRNRSEQSKREMEDKSLP